MLDKNKKALLKKIVPVSAFIGGLCCFTPVALVLLGFGSASFAASLSDTLYGSYRWLFRGAGFLFLLSAIAWHFYKKEKVCTLDQLKRKRRQVTNVVLISLILAVLAYIVWLYGIVELLGRALNVW